LKHLLVLAVFKQLIKCLVILSVLLITLYPALAQEPLSREAKEAMEKMEKDVMRMMDSLQKDPAIKRMLKEAEAEEQAWDTISKKRPTKSLTVLLPKKNTALLNAVKDTLNTVQFKTYVSQLYRKLESCLSPEEKRNIAGIHPSIINSPTALGQLSVASWYNGGTEEAAVLAAKAVTLQSAPTPEANNLCAILVLGGVSEKAIPILRYILNRNPDDPAANNNLAQAYAALGATDMAQQYISKCLKAAPHHPEANCTAAYIEASKGNRDGAIAYAERSLEGGYTEGAYSLLLKLNPPKKKLSELLAKVDLPGDFNVYKYELPRQQLLLHEGARIEAEHHAFWDALEEVSSEVQAMAASYEEKGQKIMEKRIRELQNDPMSYAKNPNRYMRPLAALGMRIAQKYAMAQYDDSLDINLKKRLDELQAILIRKTGSIDAEYKERSKGLECGEGKSGCAQLERLAKESCKKIDAARSEYLQGKAIARSNWQTKKKNEALKVFFLSSKWGYISAPEKNLAIAAYYKAADDYLTKLRSMAVYDGVQHSYCNPNDYFREDSARLPFKVPVPECPFELEIPMIVGKLSLNCEEASFGISAGATFKFTQNFASKQSTLSIGAGFAVEKGIAVGGVEAKGSAHIGQSVFITFDKNNSIADAGLVYGMGLSAGYGVKANIKIDNAGEIMAEQGVDMGRNMGEKKVSMGYSLTMNAGFTFDEGPLKDLLAPKPEKQENPKIKIYKKP
jgi:hypothetical protein